VDADVSKSQGPIIQINPYEIHISGPHFHEEIYANTTRKRDKFKWWMHLNKEGLSMFETMSHDLHRNRRAALNPFFSEHSVQALEPVIREKVDELLPGCGRR
jgi:cytochrome P450